jgi:hypothetical protein
MFRWERIMNSCASSHALDEKSEHGVRACMQADGQEVKELRGGGMNGFRICAFETRKGQGKKRRRR